MKSTKKPRGWAHFAWPLIVVTMLTSGCPTAVPVAPAATERGSESRVIKIAIQSPLSGPQRAMGEAVKLGAELASEELKSLIQNGGFRVELAPFNDQANPRIAVANARAIVADPDILVVVGHLNSSASICASEVYNAAMLAMISPASTHPFVTGRRDS